MNTEDQHLHVLQNPHASEHRANGMFRVLHLHLTASARLMETHPTSKGFDMSYISISMYLKCHVGTSTLKSESYLLFGMDLKQKRSKPAGTLSLQHYLQSEKPNYTHYTDEDALAQSYAFTRLQIPSKSVAELEKNLGMAVTDSSPTRVGHGSVGYGAGEEPPTSTWQGDSFTAGLGHQELLQPHRRAWMSRLFLLKLLNQLPRAGPRSEVQPDLCEH